MTHKQQFIAMLDDAGIDYGHTGGDSILAEGCKITFFADGRLREITAEGRDDDN